MAISGTRNYIGQTVNGYHFIAVIGEGAFARVYQATEQYVNRDVAIKVATGLLDQNSALAKRFLEEARIIARLSLHPYIVPLYSFWVDEDSRDTFIVMPLMDGGNLKELLDAHGPLETYTALTIIDNVASALHESHQQGIIHRDLKPENILLDSRGHAYLTDFGMAYRDDRTQRITSTGQIVGTPGYLAPEQLTMQPVSPSTDVYALGMLIWEMFAGEHPYAGLPIGEMMMRTVSRPLDSIRIPRPDLPEALDSIIGRATAKDPLDRYPDMELLLVDLLSVFSE